MDGKGRWRTFYVQLRSSSLTILIVTGTHLRAEHNLWRGYQSGSIPAEKKGKEYFMPFGFPG